MFHPQCSNEDLHLSEVKLLAEFYKAPFIAIHQTTPRLGIIQLIRSSLFTACAKGLVWVFSLVQYLQDLQVIFEHQDHVFRSPHSPLTPLPILSSGSPLNHSCRMWTIGCRWDSVGKILSDVMDVWEGERIHQETDHFLNAEENQTQQFVGGEGG